MMHLRNNQKDWERDCSLSFYLGGAEWLGLLSLSAPWIQGIIFQSITWIWAKKKSLHTYDKG